MMDEERKSDLQFAYDTMVKYNLWRRGYVEDRDAIDPKELGKSIDIAAGAILDYFALVGRWNHEMGQLEHALKQQECITISTKSMLDDARAEIRRLKAILAAHGIAYAKDKPGKSALKKLTQDVFSRFPKEFRYATVNEKGEARVWTRRPFIDCDEWVALGCSFGPTANLQIRLVGMGFDSSYWRNSLLEREDRPKSPVSPRPTRPNSRKTSNTPNSM